MIPSPILYLHEYEHVPKDILMHKDDEHLTPWCAESCPPPESAKTAAAHTPVLPPLLCVGIGTYFRLAGCGQLDQPIPDRGVSRFAPVDYRHVIRY